MRTIKAQITLYVPNRMYGFGKDPVSGEQFFFHLGDFRWISDTSPPPVVGEWVEGTYDPTKPQRGSAPKAHLVTRLQQPEEIYGEVETFDEVRGYGFILGDDGKSYYLHRSDMESEELIPIQGDRVLFYAGFKRGKPRACYIKVI